MRKNVSWPVSAALFLPAPLFASSMYINFIPPELIQVLGRGIGLAGILFSGVLGATGLYLARRVKLDTAGKVFTRGVLGVSAAASFGIAVLILAASFDPAASWGPVLFIAVMIFLAVEFGITAGLYRKVHREKGSPWTLVLFIVSIVLCGATGIGALALIAGLCQSDVLGAVFFLCGAITAAGAMVFRIRRGGLPATSGGVFRHGLLWLGAWLLLFIASLIMTTSGPLRKDAWAWGAILILGMYSCYQGWLYRRVAVATGERTARVMMAVHFVLGGALVLFMMLAFLGS